jgi:hypothetical protein
MTRGTRRWTEDADRRPGGVAGLDPVSWRWRDDPRPDLGDCLVLRPKPFRLVIWEPLRTKAPAPPKAAPWCCYLRTVVFYHAPFIVRPWSKPWHNGSRWKAIRPGFEQWDQIETRLSCDDVVSLEGELFLLGGGRVVWARRRWRMVHGARRHQALGVAA